MRRGRGFAQWLLAGLIAAGGVFLLVLPVVLTANPPPDPGAGISSADPSAHAPDVQQLLETTYLGRGKEFPDPGEPAVVLRQYLEQNAHGYHARLGKQGQKLNTKMAAWQALARQYPQSRHALVGLAKHYRTKALASGDIGYTRQAVDAYTRAAEIGLTHGRIRYTRELSEFLVELGDKTGLDKIFGRILAQPKDMDRDYYYLALVDYADGLARFSDDRGWGYFEEAIDLHPENNLEAINRYARHLLTRGQAQKAFDLLDTRLTSEERIAFGLPAFLRKEAAEQAGLDTAAVDAEVAMIQQLLDQGPLLGVSSSQDHSSEMAVAALAIPGSTVAQAATALVAPESAFAQAVADDRVSTIFAIPPDNTTTKTVDERVIMQDAVFSPHGAMNNRWPNMSPARTALKLATFKWPNSLRAGLVRIGTDNRVYSRYFNGASWGAWIGLAALPGGYAIDVAAVVYANNQAEIFAVANDECTIYSSRSSDGISWGSWAWWGACGDQLAVAIMPNGTGWAVLRAPGVNSYVAHRYFDGSTWASTWTYPMGTLLAVSDVDLLAYPIMVNNVKMTLWAVGSDNCSIYYRNWNGSSWADWVFWSSCFKQVSSFVTNEGGAYLIFIGTYNNYLYTERFTGSNWAGIVQQSQQTWLTAVGVGIDNDTGGAYEHSEESDDCRVAANCAKLWCEADGAACHYPININLAEIIYNEARGEVRGAQGLVGWTVRDRTFLALKKVLNAQGKLVSCGSYPGAEGGAFTTACRDPNSGVPCSDPRPQFQEISKKYCCTMHGGQKQWGTSGYQFNDEHVNFATLRDAGVTWLAFGVLNGLVPEMSTNTVPAGVSGCTLQCGSNPYTRTSPPWCTSGINYTDPSPNGPMEFRANDYCAGVSVGSLSECKRYVGDICGNTNTDTDPDPVDVRPDSACATTNPRATGDNFFWNRRQ